MKEIAFKDLVRNFHTPKQASYKLAERKGKAGEQANKINRK